MADKDSQEYDTFLQQEFERVRQESLRAFEVTLTDGALIHVFAHFHDAGASAAGHLSFIIIDPNGRHIIDRVFSVHVWQELREIQVDPRGMADAKERLGQILSDAVQESRTAQGRNTKQRRKASLQKMAVRKDVH